MNFIASISNDSNTTVSRERNFSNCLSVPRCNGDAGTRFNTNDINISSEIPRTSSHFVRRRAVHRLKRETVCSFTVTWKLNRMGSKATAINRKASSDCRSTCEDAANLIQIHARTSRSLKAITTTSTASHLSRRRRRATQEVSKLSYLIPCLPI